MRCASSRTWIPKNGGRRFPESKASASAGGGTRGSSDRRAPTANRQVRGPLDGGSASREGSARALGAPQVSNLGCEGRKGIAVSARVTDLVMAPARRQNPRPPTSRKSAPGPTRNGGSSRWAARGRSPRCVKGLDLDQIADWAATARRL